MLSKDSARNLDPDFAEKCRTALEKSYGFKIPIPKAAKPKRKLW